MRKRLLTCQPLSHYRPVGEGRRSVDNGYHRINAAAGGWRHTTAERHMIVWSAFTERAKNDVQPGLLAFMKRCEANTECAAVVDRDVAHHAADLPMAVRA